MGRFLLGFFIAALVFNTDRTIEFVGGVAEVAKTATDKAEETGRAIADKAMDEAERRGLMEPTERR